MSDIAEITPDRDIRFENFAAELTRAVYPLILRLGPTELWLNVELGLWKALAETVKTWVRQRPAVASPYELEAWREALLVSLTERAFSIAQNNGTNGFLLDLKWNLYRAVRLVARKYSRVRQSA